MSKIIERPILFSTQMVRAILDGKKTQTRRPLKIQQPTQEHSLLRILSKKDESYCWGIRSKTDESLVHPSSISPIFTPPSGRFWVRETYRPIFGQTGELISVDYKADPPEKWERLGDVVGTPVKWRPSIHMPRQASRITLEITNVRVERLQDITEEDALAEGIDGLNDNSHDDVINFSHRTHMVIDSGITWFGALWEKLYGLDSWNANPWVWVIDFEVVK